MNATPKGLCKLADRVLFEGTIWSVKEMGVKNDQGYPLDIKIVRDGWIKTVSPHTDDVLIYPPAEEVPAKLAEWANDQEVDVIRDPSNGNELEYAVACRKCRTRLWLKVVSHEASEFRYGGSDFWNGGLEITDTEMDLQCHCTDRTYSTPDDFEVSWQ